MYIEINKKLEQIRRERKLTRKDLENISGFKERTIGSYERGENYPSKEYLDFISLYFGYTKDSILDEKSDIAKLDNFTNTILMYKSIYNETDEKMAILLSYAYDDIKKYYDNIENIYNVFKNNLDISQLIKICETLHITFDCLVKDLSIFTHITPKEKEKIKELNTIGLNITPEYYASIIKKRNTPEKITPLNTLSDIPPKHQELLELLKFAPDSFADEIIKKLKEIKKLQEF